MTFTERGFPTHEVFETRLVTLIEDHFHTAQNNLPAFLEKNYCSLHPVFIRNLKGMLDLPIMGRNAAAWLGRKVGLKTSRRETWTEAKQRELFLEELLQLSVLQQKLNCLYQEVGSAFEAELHYLRQNSPRLAAMNSEHLHKEILARMEQAVQLNDATKKLLAATVIVVSTYCITGKLTKGLGPVGAAASEALYISQSGFFASLWASFFGAPVWVTATGTIVGAGLGLLLAPFFGAGFEYVLNHRKKLLKNFETALEQAKNCLLGKDQTTSLSRKPESILAQVMDYFDALTEVLDILQDFV